MWRLVLLIALLAAPAVAATPRNLLFVTLDTVRADRFGAWGGAAGTTPELDRFAQRASVFQAAYCSVATTVPSHVSMFTGLSAPEHGVWHNGDDVPAGLPSLFPLLEQAGFRVGGVVGTRLLAGDRLQPLGLPPIDWEGREFERPAAKVTADAISWLAGRGRRPFALWVHYFDTHEPYTPEPALAARFSAGYAGALPQRLETAFLLSLLDAEGPRLDAADRAHVLGLYDAELHQLDQALGRLLDYFERRGLLQNTLVVIVGDHGQAHGEADFWGHGERLLEEVTRVPLLIYHPDRRGRVIDQLVGGVDLAPTVASLLGLPRHGGWSGRSLAPLLSGRTIPEVPVLTHRRRWNGEPERRGVVVRAGSEWLRIEHDRGHDLRLGSAGSASLEILAAEALAASAGSTSDDDPELRALLESLGYVD